MDLYANRANSVVHNLLDNPAGGQRGRIVGTFTGRCVLCRCWDQLDSALLGGGAFVERLGPLGNFLCGEDTNSLINSRG